MGVLTLSTVYGMQAAILPIYNDFQAGAHEMKMVELYNSIWTQIDKKDMSTQIKSYRSLDKNLPKLYKFGIYPHQSNESISVNKTLLPNADNLVESAILLNKKTKLNFRA